MASPTIFSFSKAKQRTGRIIAMAVSLRTPSSKSMTVLNIWFRNTPSFCQASRAEQPYLSRTLSVPKKFTSKSVKSNSFNKFKF